MSIRTSMLAASVVILASAAPALAIDHVMRVGEIYLASTAGNATVQFIELEDQITEPFTNPPYSIQVFDAAGASVGMQTLTIPASTTRFLIATAAAANELGVTPQATLMVALPANGQACFKNSSALIHCHSWGTITSAVIATNQTTTSVAPTNGLSVQRVGNSYVVAAPTPNAPNSSGTVDMPMVDGPPPDTMSPDAPLLTPDAPGGNPATPKDDDGCSVGGGASWFGLVMLGLLMVVRRSSARRR